MPPDPLESSDPQPTEDRYRSGAIAFHWAMFLLVVIVGVLGLLHDSWPKRTQAFWINVHALIGISLWLVLVARFGYRLRHVPPALPTNIGVYSRRFSSPVHLTLYALMFVIPIVGFVTFIYHGRVLHFGLFDLNFGIKKTRRYLSPPRISTAIWPTVFSLLLACMHSRHCGTISYGTTGCLGECGPLEIRVFAHKSPTTRSSNVPCLESFGRT